MVEAAADFPHRQKLLASLERARANAVEFTATAREPYLSYLKRYIENYDLQIAVLNALPANPVDRDDPNAPPYVATISKNIEIAMKKNSYKKSKTSSQSS